jgi:hypothetical protein
MSAKIELDTFAIVPNRADRFGVFEQKIMPFR